MPQGETSKRRQLRGSAFERTVNTVLTDLVPTVTPVPEEATHVRVFSESSNAIVRFGFDSTVTSTNGHGLMFRVPVQYPIPPSCTVLSACRNAAGTSNIVYQFYSVGSQT